MELVGEGRTAEVFIWDEGRVVKLDRPEWTGLSHDEAGVLEVLAAAGVPAADFARTLVLLGWPDEGNPGPDRFVGPPADRLVALATGQLRA
jgi:hypothetical protein